MKPYVICHMATSIDGRTLLPRWVPKNTLPEGLFEKVYAELGPATWLVGRKTGQEYARNTSYPAYEGAKFARKPWFATRNSETCGVVLDGKGKISWGISDIEGDPIVVVLTENVSDTHLAGLRADNVSYIFAGKDVLNLSLTLDILARELGVKRLLLQGGGATNGSFFRSGLVDEISILIFPALDGAASSPGLIEAGESSSLLPVGAVKLANHTCLEGGVMWLRYVLEQNN